jgi:hypothetical protein
MAADWLDLACYSDSYGFQVDRERPYMWPWRDWVIEAFNDSLPWDDFTRWQLAGDLLPNATAQQRLAKAFRVSRNQSGSPAFMPIGRRRRFASRPSAGLCCDDWRHAIAPPLRESAR